MSPRLSDTTQPPAVKPKPFDPARLFVERDRLPWIWFGIAVLVFVVALAERVHLINKLSARENVVIVDPSHTYHVSPLLDFAEARELHAEQATLATIALLQRGPSGLDHPDLLKKFFLAGAFSKAEEQVSIQAAEFKAKQLHQKCEIERIEVLNTQANEVLANLSGQLIRNGVFGERAFSEGQKFKLQLRLLRNPNLAANGRFPMAVSDFSYETIP